MTETAKLIPRWAEHQRLSVVWENLSGSGRAFVLRVLRMSSSAGHTAVSLYVVVSIVVFMCLRQLQNAEI